MLKRILLFTFFVLAPMKIFSQEKEEVRKFETPDEAPIFPGCEKKRSNKKRKICFQEAMLNHVKDNFHYPKEAVERNLQGRVHVKFTIDTDGNIVDIDKRGPDEILENDAVRIIKLLPKMIPGKLKGKPIKVTYSVPIIYRMNK